MPGYNLAFDNVHAVEFSRTKRTPNPTKPSSRQYRSILVGGNFETLPTPPGPVKPDKKPNPTRLHNPPKKETMHASNAYEVRTYNPSHNPADSQASQTLNESIWGEECHHLRKADDAGCEGDLRFRPVSVPLG
jgi:hypothetical protein